MPATDATGPQYIDLRHYSSEWVMNCPVHGRVYLVKQYNNDWDRTYCTDCIETEDARSSRKVTIIRP